MLLTKAFFSVFFSIYNNGNKILSGKKRSAAKKARENYQNISQEEKKQKAQVCCMQATIYPINIVTFYGKRTNEEEKYYQH